MHDDTAHLSEALVRFCLDRIRRFEDFGKIEKTALEDMLALLAAAMSEALELFDAELFSDRAEGWRVKDVRPRSILTEFGQVAFRRRIYLDEYGDRRTYLDEIVSLLPRKRLSAGASHALALFGAEIPYERAAKVLFRHCPEQASAMTTMSTLREVGDLLEDAAERRREDLFDLGLAPDGARESAELFLEADGVWVALQGQRARGVEIKALCAYEGKSAGARVGVVHHALVGATERFWEEGVAKVASRYSLSALRRCYTGSDGARWCGALGDHLHGPKIIHKLDPWHLNRAVKTAFPEPADAAPLFDLLGAGRVDELLDVLALRLETGYGNETKTRALIGYIKRNRTAIEAEAPSMGTMEGTNAHLYAARMKVWGGAWSREGASDMARIRSTLASGETLPTPRRDVTFKAKDRKRREAIAEKRRAFKYEMVHSEGKGYEPPRGRLTPFSTRQQLMAMFNPLN